MATASVSSPIARLLGDARFAVLAAGALGIFTAIATVIAYPFWHIADPMARLQERSTFFEHIGLLDGLMSAAILRERQP